MIDFPKKKYAVIYADPPWAPDNKGVQGAASKKYNVMKIEDICNLPVKDISAEDSLLFMWWLASMPLEALKVVDAWGFKFKTMTCFSFLKETSPGKDHFGMGFYSRANQEQCLVARRGKNIVKEHNVTQNIREYYPGHSCKPDGAYEKIEELCGDVPRIELFARRLRPGWDSWGNQCPVDEEDLGYA